MTSSCTTLPPLAGGLCWRQQKNHEILSQNSRQAHFPNFGNPYRFAFSLVSTTAFCRFPSHCARRGLPRQARNDETREEARRSGDIKAFGNETNDGHPPKKSVTKIHTTDVSTFESYLVCYCLTATPQHPHPHKRFRHNSCPTTRRSRQRILQLGLFSFRSVAKRL